MKRVRAKAETLGNFLPPHATPHPARGTPRTRRAGEVVWSPSTRIIHSAGMALIDTAPLLVDVGVKDGRRVIELYGDGTMKLEQVTGGGVCH